MDNLLLYLWESSQLSEKSAPGAVYITSRDKEGEKNSFQLVGCGEIRGNVEREKTAAHLHESSHNVKFSGLGCDKGLLLLAPEAPAHVQGAT